MCPVSQPNRLAIGAKGIIALKEHDRTKRKQLFQQIVTAFWRLKRALLQKTVLPYSLLLRGTLPDADYGLDPVNDIEKTHTSRNIAHEALKNGDVDALGSNAGSWLNVRNKETDLTYGFFKMIARSGDLPNDMIMVGACLAPHEIVDHRVWLFDDARDIELQGFSTQKDLTTEFEDRISAAKEALKGFEGRLGMHGPYEGLDMDNKDPEVRPIVTARYLKAAETAGITLVIENILDVDPASRRAMVDSFDSDAIALSIDTGHAHLARRMSGAPPVDYFLRDAGDQLRHVHLQDLDGHADRHWAPGEGEVHWPEVFRALSECESEPHLVLEPRRKSDIPQGYEYLKGLGLVV